MTSSTPSDRNQDTERGEHIDERQDEPISDRIAEHMLVVGVDGSPASDAALVWALREAALRGNGVVAVHAWTMPYVSDISGYAVAALDPVDLASNAHVVVDDALRRARLRAPEVANVPVIPVVVDGAAGPELIALSESADLMVVGSRGHGSFTGLLLGSVSQTVAHHAHCPVVIVHPEETAAAGHARLHHRRGAVR